MFLRFLLVLQVLTFSNAIIAEEKGVVVAFAGLSGSGKTTIAKALEHLCKCCILTEPEESEWPDVVKRKDEFGYFSMWMGFRQLWLPLQYAAQHYKDQNRLVFLDSYFIKIIGYELSEPGCEWLFPNDDPYFHVFQQICQLDIAQLPDPDYIVLFDVTFEDWIRFLDSRNRSWDKTPGFFESYESTRKAIHKAVVTLCKERHIKLIHFQHEFGNVDEQAKRLKSFLIQNKVLIFDLID